MNALETLAHVGNPAPAPGHGPYWNRWSDRVWEQTPILRVLSSDDPLTARTGDPGVNIVFDSLQGVRIGGRLIEPASGPVRGVVLALHGYAKPDRLNDESPWTGAGLATLKLRVRGYPGSMMDLGDLTKRPGGWIVEGLESPKPLETWALRGAVADVVNALRALRDRYGEETPISMHGESFGAGLAILAASQLVGRDEVFRMAIGLPTLGDWPWRLRNVQVEAEGVGVGAEIARQIERSPGQRTDIERALRIFDAAVHARRVTCPTLCKLAELDEVAPAPSAAAVYNGLGSDPGLKWRFITRYGHYDGGVADLRRHALFDRLAASFLDPAVDLQSLMATWGSRLATGDSAP